MSHVSSSAASEPRHGCGGRAQVGAGAEREGVAEGELVRVEPEGDEDRSCGRIRLS